MKKYLRAAVTVLLVAVMGFSLFQLLKIWREYSAGTQLYDAAASQYTVSQSVPAADSQPEAEAPPITVDFDALRAANPDVVGWLYCEGTTINYPVLQGEDNDEYLYHMLDGSYNSSGSLFLDYQCSADFSDLKSIIYGHNMKNGSMFASLRNYRDAGYYQEHPTMWLFTPTATYRIDLLAGFVAADDDRLYSYMADTNTLHTYLSMAMNKSTFESDLSWSTVEQLLVLSTCTYEYDNARYLVLGVPTRVE